MILLKVLAVLGWLASIAMIVVGFLTRGDVAAIGFPMLAVTSIAGVGIYFAGEGILIYPGSPQSDDEKAVVEKIVTISREDKAIRPSA